MFLVITGKDKGKSGSILSIIPKKNRAIVKGVNIVKKTSKNLLNKVVEELLKKNYPYNFQIWHLFL